MDYDSGPYNVTIPVGKTSGTFNITINDDDISEGNETFMITITSSASITCVDHCQATLTILDNDGKKLYVWYQWQYMNRKGYIENVCKLVF